MEEISWRGLLRQLSRIVSVVARPNTLCGHVTQLPKEQIKSMGALRKDDAISQRRRRKTLRIECVEEFDAHSARAARVGVDTVEPGRRLGHVGV